MTISAHDFRMFVVEPATALCVACGAPDTPYVRDLLVATAAQESAIGRWLHQAGGGPAVGVFQIEPASLHDLVRGFIEPSKKIMPTWTAARLPVPVEEQVLWDLRLAAIVARLFYYRVPASLPKETTQQTLWTYYKTYWNTTKGAATEGSFVQALHSYTDMAHLV